jgi:adenylate kinase family enzyme
VAPEALVFDPAAPALRSLARESTALPKICPKSNNPRGRMMIVGTTCTGKTTLACSLARLFDWPHVEFDALFWNSNWQYAPNSVVGQRLEASIAGSDWILDGNCVEFKDLVWPRIDTLIWLDYSLPIVLWRAVKRTIWRCRSGELLWGKNIETWRRSLCSRNSAIYWAIKSWQGRRRQYNEILRQCDASHVTIHRFRSPAQTADWLCRRCFEHNLAQRN